MQTERAAQAPGVLLVMTHENAPKLPAEGQKAQPPGDRALSLLQDDQVAYSNQPSQTLSPVPPSPTRFIPSFQSPVPIKGRP